MSAENVSKIIIPKSPAVEFAEKIAALRDQIAVDNEFFHNAVIVAKFIREKIGTLYTAQSTQTEDKWQGKTGLVVTVGPSAFQNEPGFDFHGQKVTAGEWAIYRHTDGWDFDYTIPGTTEKLHLRWLEDSMIKGRTKRPELFW